jgi:circadian clock protein KaiC
MSYMKSEVAPTGIEGLDRIMKGGLVRGGFYLVHGQPGTGKTTLALQFLFHGQKQGEKSLHLSFSESRTETERATRVHGWDLDVIEMRELATRMIDEKSDQPSIFHPTEVDLPYAMGEIYRAIDEVKPDRLVIDSLTELRHVAESPRHFRRALLRLKDFLEARGIAWIAIDEIPESFTAAETLAHGVIILERRTPAYGPNRRRLQVAKLRAVEYLEGYHDCVIVSGGLKVFPAIRSKSGSRRIGESRVMSGIKELDQMMGAGIPCGTTLMITGPSGAGKSTLSLQFAMGEASRHRRAAIFSFDEDSSTIRERARSVNIPLETQLENGNIRLEVMDPATLSPGEFADRLRKEVEGGVSVIIIDSLNGYLLAMPEESALVPHLHDMLMFCGRAGVTMIVVLTLAGLLDAERPMTQELSYLADSIVSLRYFEAAGAVRTAIAAVKHRTGAHDRVIREFALDSEGIRIGSPLTEFENVLTGSPRYIGASSELLRKRDS